LYRGQLINPEADAILDEALVVFMPAPHSYTGEDVVEFYTHGSPLLLQHLLRLTLHQGAQLAQPGEFTQRAFLAGKIDLSQAEAVIDIIEAKTEAGLRLAQRQLAGDLSAKIRSIRDNILSVLAYLEASIDFTEDEIPEMTQEDIARAIGAARQETERLLADAEVGIIYRQGVRVAIIGRPNVGKSSLLNALLRTNRAIVTPTPGTTRDTIEESVNIGGAPVCLIDTAGIAEAREEAEALGVERSHQALKHSDLVILVLDGSQPLTTEDEELIASLEQAERQARLVVVNKIDLLPQISPKTLEKRLKRLKTRGVIFLSAATGKGLDKLEEALREAIFSGRVQSEDVLVGNIRHRDALERAARHLTAAGDSVDDGMAADFVAIDLYGAINALGEITGETVGDDVLEQIFSRFCVGK